MIKNLPGVMCIAAFLVSLDVNAYPSNWKQITPKVAIDLGNITGKDGYIDFWIKYRFSAKAEINEEYFAKCSGDEYLSMQRNVQYAPGAGVGAAKPDDSPQKMKRGERPDLDLIISNICKTVYK